MPSTTQCRPPTNQADLVDRLEPYRAYLTLLARVQVGRRLRGKADPDDLVQETFLAAVAGADRFRGAGETEFTAWLRRILLSRVLKLVERYYGCAARDVRRELTQVLEASSASLHNLPALLPADQSTPSRAAQRREQAVIVADTLASLTADHRDVLTLRHLEGLSFPDVAERMGRSVGAVTMLWTRAVRQFRHAHSADLG